MQRPNFPQERLPSGVNGLPDRAGVLLNFENPFQQYRMTSVAQQGPFPQQQLHMHMNTAPMNHVNGGRTSNINLSSILLQ